MLYAGGLPTFVVDTYTHRVLARHGWIGYDAGYHEIKDHFESSLPADAALYNEYHALLVRARQGVLPQDGAEVRSVSAGGFAAGERNCRTVLGDGGVNDRFPNRWLTGLIHVRRHSKLQLSR